MIADGLPLAILLKMIKTFFFVLNIFHQKDQVNARLHPFGDFLLQALSTVGSLPPLQHFLNLFQL